MGSVSAHVSLLGDRKENQDRVSTIESDGATLLIVVDGMGGHEGGAHAAELAVASIEKAFRARSHPIFDPQGFLHLALGQAHAAVVALGSDRSLETRPRATCALCLIQDGAAFWAHVGDSRIYHMRDGKVREHSRDHSHVEVLLYDGLIEEEQLASHPMRNYVERCLGGDVDMPRVSVTGRKALAENDCVLVCSDGFWSPLGEEKIGQLSIASGEFKENLETLAEMATRAASPHSDNTSVAALCFNEAENADQGP
jgi:serine/threonine protein phosphatase PrpC